MKVLKYLIVIFFFLGINNNSFALFIVPKDAEVDESKYDDLTEVYSEFIPETLKPLSDEDKIKYFNGKSASCIKRNITMPTIKRNLPPMPKKNILKKHTLNPETNYLIKFILTSIIVMIGALVLILKTRDFGEE